MTADEFYAGPVAMRRGGRRDPGFTAVIGKEAILFFKRIVCEIAADNYELIATMFFMGVFDGDGVCAGAGLPLKDREGDD